METFGEYLKAQREKKGIRLEEIASITKIHHHTLRLIENGEWKKLPPEPFIRGFIIAYAKYVGADSKVAIQKYNEEVHGAANVEAVQSNELENGVITHKAPTQHSSNPSAPIEPPPHEMLDQVNYFSPRRILTVGGVAVAGILAVTVIYYGKSNLDMAPATPTVAENTVQDTTPLQREPTSPDAAVATEQTPQVAGAPQVSPVAPAPVVPETPKGDVASAAVKEVPEAATEFAHEVVIEGQHRTWTKIVIDGDAPIEFFLPEKQKATYRAKEKIKVVLGNSAGSKVVHNGKEEAGVKFHGTIRSYIFPENARFPQDVVVRKTAEDLKEQEEASTEKAN